MAPFLRGQTVFHVVVGANGASDTIVRGTVLGTDEADVLFKDSNGHISIKDRHEFSHECPVLSYDYRSGRSHAHYGPSEPVAAPPSPSMRPSYEDFRNGYFCGTPSPTYYETYPTSPAFSPPHFYSCHDDDSDAADAADALLALSRDVAIY